MHLEILVFAAVFSGLMGGYFLVSYLSARRELETHMEKYVIPRESGLKKSWERMTAWFNDSQWGKDLQVKLNAAGINLKPFEYGVIFLILVAIALWLVRRYLGLALLWDLIIAWEIVRFLTKRFLKARQKKVIGEINKQLPEVCRYLSSAVRAGLSIQQGIELVAKELKPPAGQYFRTLANEMRLGANLADAFENLTEQLNSREIRLMANSIIIQRRTGGNLGKVLEEMAATLEQRERANQEIAGSTAESKFVAYVLPFMPVMVAIMFNATFPGTIANLFKPLGLILLVISGLMMFAGFFLIYKITSVKV